MDVDKNAKPLLQREGWVFLTQYCLPLSRKHSPFDALFPRFMLSKPNVSWTLLLDGNRIFLSEVSGPDVDKVEFTGSIRADQCAHDIQCADDDSSDISDGTVVLDRAPFKALPDFSDDVVIVVNDGVGKIGSVKSLKANDYIIHLSVFLTNETPDERVRLANDLEKVLNARMCCDVELRLVRPGNSDAKKCKMEHMIPAHKAILCARSPYFAGLFGSAMTEANENIVSVEFSLNVVEALLYFMYTGRLKNIPGTEKELLKAADYYGLNSLKLLCEDLLLEVLLPENAIEMAVIGDEYGAGALKKEAISTIVRHLNEVRSRDEWRDFLRNHSDIVDEIMLTFHEQALLRAL